MNGSNMRKVQTSSTTPPNKLAPPPPPTIYPPPLLPPPPPKEKFCQLIYFTSQYVGFDMIDMMGGVFRTECGICFRAFVIYRYYLGYVMYDVA